MHSPKIGNVESFFELGCSLIALDKSFSLAFSLLLSTVT